MPINNVAININKHITKIKYEIYLSLCTEKKDKKINIISPKSKYRACILKIENILEENRLLAGLIVRLIYSPISISNKTEKSIGLFISKIQSVNILLSLSSGFNFILIS